jgi:hypothetical protein
MVIGWEKYESIDLEVLAAFKQRGIRNSVILFMEHTPSNLQLPPKFADCGRFHRYFFNCKKAVFFIF